MNQNKKYWNKMICKVNSILALGGSIYTENFPETTAVHCKTKAFPSFW